MKPKRQSKSLVRVEKINPRSKMGKLGIVKALTYKALPNAELELSYSGPVYFFDSRATKLDKSGRVHFLKRADSATKPQNGSSAPRRKSRPKKQIQNHS